MYKLHEGNIIKNAKSSCHEKGVLRLALQQKFSFSYAYAFF